MRDLSSYHYNSLNFVVYPSHPPENQPFFKTLSGYKLILDCRVVGNDELASSYESLPRISRLALEQRRRAIAVRYRPDLRENETSQEIVENVGGAGTETEVELQFVYDRETADRMAYQQGQRELSRRRQVEFRIDPRNINTDIVVGGKVRIPNNLAGAANTDWIVTSVRVAADKQVLVVGRQYRPGLFSYPSNRQETFSEDTYDPPTDFSETPPEPLRNLRARTESIVDGSNTLYESIVEFTRPKENYSQAEIHVALADSDARFATFEDPANPGQARFDLPLELTSYSVIAYSISENGLIRGSPVEFSVNQTPTADAGADRTVSAGASVTLNGSGSSDPDNDTLTYLWEQLSGTPVSLNNATSESASFTAPRTVGQSHVLEFQLTVSDGETSGTDSVIINVRPASPPPPPSNPPGRPGGRTTGPFVFQGIPHWSYAFSAPTDGGTPTYYEARRNISGTVYNWTTETGPLSTSNIPYPTDPSHLALIWIELRACNAGGCGPTRRLTAP